MAVIAIYSIFTILLIEARIVHSVRTNTYVDGSYDDFKDIHRVRIRSDDNHNIDPLVANLLLRDNSDQHSGRCTHGIPNTLLDRREDSLKYKPGQRNCSDLCERSLCPWVMHWHHDPLRTPEYIKRAECAPPSSSSPCTELSGDTQCETVRIDIPVWRNDNEDWEKDWPVACVCTKIKRHVINLSFRKRSRFGNHEQTNSNDALLFNNYRDELKALYSLNDISQIRAGRQNAKKRSYPLQRVRSVDED